MLSGEGNAGERWKTTIGLISKKATFWFCTCSTLFLYISLPLFFTTTTWNFQKLLSYTFFGGTLRARELRYKRWLFLQKYNCHDRLLLRCVKYVQFRYCALCQLLFATWSHLTDRKYYEGKQRTVKVVSCIRYLVPNAPIKSAEDANLKTQIIDQKTLSVHVLYHTKWKINKPET